MNHTYLEVSIPFKREGLSEPEHTGTDMSIEKVSIPFKREGLSELLVQCERVCISATEVFQFPSNGKDFPNLYVMAFLMKYLGTIVSIPFKREGLSEQSIMMN